ncbi:kinase-like protein [Favolaschia claudopus]|uniref:Kinase-like protein n=1 Tax=Favolaschia claudopus TaxID=2862362 RepID=A0AAW0AFM3_9AGAR
MLSLNTALDLVSGMVPVPGLAPALTLLKFIIASVEQTRASQKQLAGLTITLAQLLATINTEFQSSKLIEASCIQPLEDLRSVLLDVNRFVQKEQGLNFFRSLFRTEARISEIEMFYRRIDATASAFQISASLNIQANLRDNERARQEDAVALNGRFTTLESNNVELKQALDINQKSTRALIVSLERRIGRHEGSNPERKFLSHTLQYLASTSSEQVKVEDWMISPFDVDHGQEIGSGGFGTVYKGTWNRTQVAIKLIRNQSGVAASADLLRKEIDIWMTLRHPNILQFLGANTLDDQPFVVMPLMPYNSRQFLRAHRDYDPLVILRDISLGLEYLHARKISHGDLKGINVLVEDSGRALLCDFGLTRIKADITSRTHAAEKVVVSGSRNWMAPEMLSGTLPRPSSDLYAFGMTIYELFMDEIPLSAIPYSDFIELVFKFGTRPQRPDPDDCPRMTDDIWNLAVRCWDKDPHVRPTARQIHDNINLLTTGSARGGAQRNPSIIPVKRHVSNPFPSTTPPARQSQIEGSESSPPPSGLPSNVTHPKRMPNEPIQENSLTVKVGVWACTHSSCRLIHVQIVTSETFRQHEGFDLACFEGKNWLISVLPTFSVDEQELYSTFKRKVAEYFKHPIHQFRLWVQTRRDNKIRRPEFWIRELGDSALTVGHIKQDEDPEGSNLYLYLDLLGESTTATPSADTILVFLKYFDLTRQQLRGYDTVQIPRSSKAKALVQLIQQKMGSLATKALNLYQEIGPSTVKLLDLNLSFVESEMVDGDVVCFERQDASSMPLDSNAIQFYESLQYRVNLLFRPRKPMSALNVALPRFSFIIDRRETYSSVSR